MISTAIILIMYGRCQVLKYYVLICTLATAISTVMGYESAVVGMVSVLEPKIHPKTSRCVYIGFYKL